jgi:hypothetical protein
VIKKPPTGLQNIKQHWVVAPVKKKGHPMFGTRSGHIILDAHNNSTSLIYDKSVTTQNLAFLSYWYRKKRLQMHF